MRCGARIHKCLEVLLIDSIYCHFELLSYLHFQILGNCAVSYHAFNKIEVAFPLFELFVEKYTTIPTTSSVIRLFFCLPFV